MSKADAAFEIAAADVEFLRKKEEKAERRRRRVKAGKETVIILLGWAGVLLWVFQSSFVGTNTQFVDGYPNIANSVETYVNQRYSVQWCFIFILYGNLFVVAFTLALDGSPLTNLLHWTAVIVMGISSFVIVIFLGGVWLFRCNKIGSLNSTCNSYQWCSTYYAEYPEFCPNTGPFSPAPDTLDPNLEFQLQWAIAAGWVIYNVFNFGLSERILKR